MSYILDALKKAERDRRHAHIPSVDTMHAAPPERRIVWPWIAAGLFAVNVVAIAAVFGLRPTTGAPAATAPTVAAPAPVAAPMPVPAPASVAAPEVVPSSSTPPAAPANVPAPMAVAPSTAPVTPVATPSSPKPAPTVRPSASASSPPGRPTPARVEPEALKLEVLVFSENPAERSAWINGQRYVEGQRVQGRFIVEQIVRDGVVLTGDGKRTVLKQE